MKKMRLGIASSPQLDTRDIKADPCQGWGYYIPEKKEGGGRKCFVRRVPASRDPS